MEDMIDFPCSDTWLGWYHEIGLTPRKPATSSWESKLEEVLDRILQRLDDIEQRLTALEHQKSTNPSRSAVRSKQSEFNLEL